MKRKKERLEVEKNNPEKQVNPPSNLLKFLRKNWLKFSRV